jgi:homoserine kinase
VLGLCLDNVGRNDYQKINQRIRITKIVGADLPLETEKNVAGVAGLAFAMRLKQILVLISKSIKT